MKSTRYAALADEIEQAIAAGVLRPGDRLPSVRQTCASHTVSPSTVFQAYYLLEARGLVRARERSGWFVTEAAPAAPPEPAASSAPDGNAVELDVSAMVFDILEASMSRAVAPFGSAFPGPELFPLARLGQEMAAAAQSLDPRATVDDLTPGLARLRRQIARRYLADGIAVDPDEIVITNGALEALNLCLAAVTRPGDAVLVESPCFYGALQALERLGLRAIEVPTHPRDGIDLDALASAVSRHAPRAAWLMPSFQNPLGALMPEARKRELVALLARHGIPLIEDDVYGELWFGERRPPPAKAFDAEGLVLHCSSFSKSLAPGYRIGWAIPGRFRKTVARQKLSLSIATSAPAQIALAAYLERGGHDRHLRRLRETLRIRQASVLRAIAAHFPEGTRATRPEGGYFTWVELPAGGDALALHRRALAAGISIAPGPIFSAGRGFGHCLRINCGHAWDERAHDAIATLGRLAGRAG
ncbi:PLP-dependent aminotransferase family protein [Derxia gummosa]|uniref:PLP-dependent aminotransferase family protein n=1 Tax=Derxia gummosa DSM 723 TaxID=1121388 RepID=A0A8B6X4R1_9BURK|nr:PLP-dependent aminotransferase family protein [Derxia gummosa]